MDVRTRHRQMGVLHEGILSPLADPEDRDRCEYDGGTAIAAVEWKSSSLEVVPGGRNLWLQSVRPSTGSAVGGEGCLCLYWRGDVRCGTERVGRCEMMSPSGAVPV